jgi:peptidoglycan/LPS O-acetylase OafA/YrhL
LNSRNHSLDVLRGIAILLVLGRHAPYVEYSPYLNLWFRIGWSGVDLFFVLSGFLISGLLFTEFKRSGTIDVKRFWIRRGFKIYPAFYTLGSFLVAISLFRTGRVPRALLGDVFFVQNYLPHITDHGWSLAVEEHFYLMLPLFFAALMWIERKSCDPFRAIPLTSLALTIICLGMRISASSNHALWDQIAYPTHLRIDALLLGVTLGYYFHFQSLQVRRRWLIMLCGCLLLLPAFAFGTGSIFTATVGLTMTSLGYACILIWAIGLQWKRAWALAWIGRYSYSIYLWHAIIATFSKNTIGETRLSFGIYLVASLVVGGVMAKLVELPLLRIREHLMPAVAEVRQGTEEVPLFAANQALLDVGQ